MLERLRYYAAKLRNIQAGIEDRFDEMELTESNEDGRVVGV